MKTVPNRWHLSELSESDKPGRRPKTKNSHKLQTVAPLKICIAFNEDASARSAEVLIKHIASDLEYVNDGQWAWGIWRHKDQVNEFLLAFIKA